MGARVAGAAIWSRIFFPLDFQRVIARDRLNVEPDTVPGGHLIALSNPDGLADYLLHR